MPDPRPDDEGLFGREARHREDLLTTFEEQWRAGAPPDVAAFVRKFLPPWLPRREPTVAELIRVDQEFRIKRGDQSRVEDYLARLNFRPERGELLDLVLGEFTLRSRFQTPPAPDEYADRFPELADDLRRHLAGWKEAASAEFVPPGAGAVLHVSAGPHRGTAIRLEPGRPLVVGRAESADVRLADDRHLSRHHLRLELAGGVVRFCDLNSRNGTLLDDEPAREGEVRPGETLRCGESAIVLAPDAKGTLELSDRAALQCPPEADGVPGYELHDPLGRGTLGVTYAAVRIATGEQVAVKRIELPGAAMKTVAVIRETAALQAVADSVLLLPIDVGLTAGRPHVVTPRLHAIPFDELAVGKSPAERLPAACRIVGRVLAALGPLHEKGIVHGDVKQSNVLLEPAGHGLRVKLMDFGLARCFGRADAGDEPSDDLIAVGRLLSGYVYGSGQPQAPDGLPDGAAWLLARAVDPEEGFRDAAEFLRELAAFGR